MAADFNPKVLRSSISNNLIDDIKEDIKGEDVMSPTPHNVIKEVSDNVT